MTSEAYNILNISRRILFPLMTILISPHQPGVHPLVCLSTSRAPAVQHVASVGLSMMGDDTVDNLLTLALGTFVPHYTGTQRHAWNVDPNIICIFYWPLEFKLDNWHISIEILLVTIKAFSTAFPRTFFNSEFFFSWKIHMYYMYYVNIWIFMIR